MLDARILGIKSFGLLLFQKGDNYLLGSSYISIGRIPLSMCSCSFLIRTTSVTCSAKIGRPLRVPKNVALWVYSLGLPLLSSSF
jgi:hypothetical protein